MSKKNKELAADYFERFKESEECHITADERIFHTKGNADSFAAGLTDPTVKTFKRVDFKIAQMEVVVDEDDDLTDEEKAAVEEARCKKQDCPSAGSEPTETDEEIAKRIEIEAAEKADADAIASEKILAFDTEKATYEEAKELVKEMNLAKEGNKKEDLFNAIVAAQTAIKDKA